MQHKQYKFIHSLTSDVLFEAYGKTPKELFENAAKALLSVVCQIGKVKPTKAVVISVKGKDVKELMFNWLQELVTLVDVRDMFFSRFVVEKINEKSLKAKIYGEPASPEKGETLVKAVTLYKFNVEKTKEGYKATVSLDI